MELTLRKNDKEIAYGPLSRIIFSNVANYDAIALAIIVYEHTNIYTGKIRNADIISSFLIFIAKWPLLDNIERSIVCAELQKLSEEHYNPKTNLLFWLNLTEIEITYYLDELSRLELKTIECN